MMLSTMQCKGGCGRVITTASGIQRGARMQALYQQHAGYCTACSPVSEQEMTTLQGQAMAAIAKPHPKPRKAS